MDQAAAWVADLDGHYWDGKRGGYFYTADDAEALITRTRNAADNAVPSGNGTMLGVLARLWYLTGRSAYRQRADALRESFTGELARNFFPLATLLNAFETLDGAVQVVIIGDRNAAATGALIRAAYSVSAPNRVLAVIEPGAALPAGHPATGKSQQDGKPTAYVCVGPTCSLPLTESGALARQIRNP